MSVYEVILRLAFKKRLHYEELSEMLSYFIDSALGMEPKYLAFHEEYGYKYYVFDLAYPCEESRFYEVGKIYTVRIRTVKSELAEFFSQKLPYHETREICGRGGDGRILPKKILESVYTLTPALVKLEEGYWRQHMSQETYEKRLYANLVKKYKQFTGENLEEDFLLYDLIEFKNKKPVKVQYKGIHLLGDKISFIAAKNKKAQELWYFALGTGICENNARGAGFLNYKYL